MSKFEFVASGDAHLCIDVQCPAGRHLETFYDEQRAKLSFIKKYCLDHDIKNYIIPGDLLNYKNPSIYTSKSINSLQSELIKLGENLDILTIAGNHDLKMSSREMKPSSVYNIFSDSGVIKDLTNRITTLSDDVTISGIDFNPCKEDLLREVSELNSKLKEDYPTYTNILVLHEHLLPGEESLPFGGHLNYSEFLPYDQINILVSGHLHKGYPTETIGSVDIEGDGCQGHQITFINPWSLTRVARDHYALSDEHKPEIVHVTIEDHKVSFKHIEVEHKGFDLAFVKEALCSEENQELDISEFVSSLTEFSTSTESSLEIVDKSEAVRDKIKHYTELAESKMG